MLDACKTLVDDSSTTGPSYSTSLLKRLLLIKPYASVAVKPAGRVDRSYILIRVVRLSLMQLVGHTILNSISSLFSIFYKLKLLAVGATSVLAPSTCLAGQK